MYKTLFPTASYLIIILWKLIFNYEIKNTWSIFAEVIFESHIKRYLKFRNEFLLISTCGSLVRHTHTKLYQEV